MKTIKKMHHSERPREKLIKYGVSKLSMQELLAIIIKTGSKKKNALSIAEEIIKKFNSSLEKTSISKLKGISGIGDVKAIEIIASIEIGKRILNKTSLIIKNAKQIWELSDNIRNKKKEHSMAIYLNAQNQMIEKEIISIGTVNETLAHPREVFEPAIKHNASAIILCHNHPSNDLNPSKSDIETTKILVKASKIIGIEILDHLIVTGDNYTSLKQKFPQIFK